MPFLARFGQFSLIRKSAYSALFDSTKTIASDTRVMRGGNLALARFQAPA
jgi:hypothetical protein